MAYKPMNAAEVESFIDMVRKAQSAGPYLDTAQLEHIKVLALLTIAQRLAYIEELGIRSTVATDGNFVLSELK
jgi:hypothetical protein